MRGALGRDFRRNAPATVEELASAEPMLKLVSKDWRVFLQAANGGEGFIGKTYVVLWRAEEIVEYNRGYEVSESAPGLVLFGSDGRGEAYAFDTRTSASSVVMVPFVGLSLNYAKKLAPSFRRFLAG